MTMPTAPPGGENWNYTISGILCQNLIKICPPVMKPRYITLLWGIVSFSGLKMLFFDHIQPWQHLTQQIQLLLWQQHSQNSFQTSHQSRLWPHPLTGTPQSNTMISSCFTNQWKVGSPSRIFQWKQPQELDLMRNPTRLDWNMCSISWATLATGNLTVGSQLAQLMRFQRRKSKLQPSWTTCPLWWIMQCHNTAESINWKMSTSGPESHQMNSLTISMLLLTDVTSHQMRKRNRTSSTDSSEPSMTRKLIKKLLALDLKATTPKMLEVCQTHRHLRQPRGQGTEGTEDSKCDRYRVPEFLTQVQPLIYFQDSISWHPPKSYKEHLATAHVLRSAVNHTQC